MRVITWCLRAFLFFVLFAFALNNQHEARLKWFFGYEWRAPMVIIVLAVFAVGAILGLVGHLPAWWRHLRGLRSAPAVEASASAAKADAAATRSAPGPDTLLEPPRDGL